MDTSNEDHNKKGRKRLRKAIYKRDPEKPDQAPRKPPELVHGKSQSVRFTQAEWASILLKATQAGKTPSAFIRASALGVEMRAVVGRVWTKEERTDYRVLVDKLNMLTLAPAADTGDDARQLSADTAELCVLIRQLLTELVPPQVG